MDDDKKFNFRKPDFEASRRELPERLQKMRKFEESMDRALRVSSKTWLKQFDL